MDKLTIEKINAMNYDQFIETFGNVIEHCPICSAAVWANKPFDNLKALHTAICLFVDQLPSIGQEGILRLHPDLAGRLAQTGGLTSESLNEQSSAGLTKLTPEEKKNLQEMNQRYKSKFGFPFVICARENKKQAILSGITSRLENDKMIELEKGTQEVKKIAFYRLLDIIQHTEDEVQL